jgi:virulence factor Mce-like protein
MPNTFDLDGRGPSNRRLIFAGLCFLLIGASVVALLITKSKGRLERIVRVSAELVDVGDGLPAKSDVKFRGVLVGYVSDVVPASNGRPNIVKIDLGPEYASGIPDTVTARVVPSNIFAVSSVELVDNGRGLVRLRDGAVLHEDQSLPTVLFQTTLTKFRAVLAAVGREPSADSVGALTALGEATEGRGHRLQDAGRELNDLVTQLNSVVATDTGPSTISALTAAADGLRNTAPELLDALDSAVKPMQTLAQKRSALTTFLSAGLNTSGTLADAFDNQTDRLIAITTELTPVVGVLADNAAQFDPIFTRMQRVADKFYSEAWNPETNVFTMKGIVSFTPTRTYIRADCPRYGELAGPSCQTAPEVPTAPALLPALQSHGFPPPLNLPENRPNLAPPRGSIIRAPESPADPAQDSPPTEPPALAPLPGESPPPAPADSGAPGGTQPQSTVIGGKVGPVGSGEEKHQLGVIVGGQATTATELLLGPLARGATVRVAPDTGGDR